MSKNQKTGADHWLKFKQFLWKLSKPTIYDSYFNMVVAAWVFLLLFGPLSYNRVPLALLPMVLTAVSATIFHLYVIYKSKRHDDIYFYAFYYEFFGPLLMFSLMTFGVYGLVYAEDTYVRIFALIPFMVPLYYLAHHVIAIEIDDNGVTIYRLAGNKFIEYSNIEKVEEVEEDYSSSEDNRHIIRNVYIYTVNNQLIKLGMTDEPRKTCRDLVTEIKARLPV